MRLAPRRLAVTAVAVGVAGCGGDQASTAPTASSAGAAPAATAGTVVVRTPNRELRDRGSALQLTSVLPRSVRRACATAAAKSRALVYCPPLVPTGPALVDGVDGVLRSPDFRSGFVANFESHSVRPSRSAPGHWTIAEGDARALRALLHPPDYDTREGRITRRPLRIDHAAATLWMIPSFRIFHGI